jgi:hypothetical protein
MHTFAASEEGEMPARFEREAVEAQFLRYKTAVEAHGRRKGRLGGHKRPDDKAISLAMLQEFKELNRMLRIFLSLAMEEKVGSAIPMRFDY